MGIEPTFSAWEADVLPLNYTRIIFICLTGFPATVTGCKSTPLTTGQISSTFSFRSMKSKLFAKRRSLISCNLAGSLYGPTRTR